MICVHARLESVHARDQLVLWARGLTHFVFSVPARLSEEPARQHLGRAIDNGRCAETGRAERTPRSIWFVGHGRMRDSGTPGGRLRRRLASQGFVIRPRWGVWRARAAPLQNPAHGREKTRINQRIWEGGPGLSRACLNVKGTQFRATRAASGKLKLERGWRLHVKRGARNYTFGPPLRIQEFSLCPHS